MYQVVYLTGAPAAGKSSLTRRLKDLIQPLKVWEFGEHLTAYLNTQNGTKIDQTTLREQSGKLAGPEDIAAVDDLLIDFVKSEREHSHVVIDSHPVTKENYGFRVTAYSLERFRQLAPTQIWMLYTDPEVALRRIQADAQGRPVISLEEARFHTHAQASVAVTYGMSLGVPVYFFDSDRAADVLDQELALRFR